MMRLTRLDSGRRFIASIALLAAMTALGGPGMAQPAEGFPFDQELLLNTAPMRPGKRMPSITIERNGNAVIDLWCKSVPAHVELSDTSIKIDVAAMPDELPQMQSNGQCTPERMAADATLLEKFSGVTAWQREGGAIVFNGAVRLKFSAPSN
jgi:heat shock protein HslJ